MNNNEYGYVYLLKVREFINTDIIKIGMTSNYKKRLFGYPKGSFYIKYIKVINYKNIEKILLKIFNNKYIKKKEYGNEYFKGDIDNILLTFITIIEIHKNIIPEFKKKYIANKNIINNINPIINSNNKSNNINSNNINSNNTTTNNINNNNSINNSNNNTNNIIINKKIIINNLLINDNMKYICKKCNYKTNYKHSYDRHINRKTSCNRKTSYNKKKIKCEYCNINFTLLNNYYRHKKNVCKVLNNNIKDDEIQELEKELKKTELTIKKKELYLKDKELDSKIKKLEINDNNTNNNNITNNINIVAYGKEDMSIINKEDLKSIFKDGSHSIQKILKFVNFNKDYPENHNIFSNNLKNNYVKLYNGETWEMHKYGTAFLLILNEKLNYLKKKFNEMANEIDIETFTNFNNFIKDFDDCKLNTNLQENLKLFLYNNRHYAKRTHKFI